MVAVATAWVVESGAAEVVMVFWLLEEAWVEVWVIGCEVAAVSPAAEVKLMPLPIVVVVVAVVAFVGVVAVGSVVDVELRLLVVAAVVAFELVVEFPA